MGGATDNPLDPKSANNLDVAIQGAGTPALDFDTVVERLARMKEHESDRLEKYDAQLLGCRITTLHSAIRKKRAELNAAEAADEPASVPPAVEAKSSKADSSTASQAKKLLDLAEHGIDLFYDSDRTGFARVHEGERIITAPIDSKEFKFVLRQRYYRVHRSSPNEESLRSAISTLEARANSEGEQCEVALRVAHHDGCVYLNLARDDGAIVEVSPSGWRIVHDSPVRFWLPSAMRALPLPSKNGSITALSRILNLASKTDFILTVAWLLATCSPGPYPIAGIVGEQGSAKSTATRLLRMLIDPNKANLRNLPREDRDLAVACRNSFVMAFDNISSLPDWLSDALARVATGGGFTCRALYSNADEFVFDGRRPIALNGITDFVERPDLLDRCLLLRLSPIAESDRKTEAEIDARFEQEAPGILGSLLDAVAYGLGNPEEPEKHPRMADFAKWITSCEGFFNGTKLKLGDEPETVWRAGDFIRAYDANRKDAIETALNAEAVAETLMSFMDARTSWTGTATELLSALGGLVDDDVKRDRGWPKSHRALSARLGRLATALRAIGIEIKRDKTTDKIRTRLITLSRRTQTQADDFASGFASDDEPLKNKEKSDLSDARTQRTQILHNSGETPQPQFFSGPPDEPIERAKVAI